MMTFIYDYKNTSNREAKEYNGKFIEIEHNASFDLNGSFDISYSPIEPRFDFEQIIIPEETKRDIFDALNVIKHKNLIYKIWGFERIDSKPRSV